MAAKAGAETKKKTSTQRQKEEEKRERSEKLNAQKSALESRLAAVEALRSGYEIPVLEGQEVEHTQYGPGTVVSQREAVITVRYGNVEKKQKLPFVVAGGFMQTSRRLPWTRKSSISTAFSGIWKKPDSEYQLYSRTSCGRKVHAGCPFFFLWSISRSFCRSVSWSISRSFCRSVSWSISRSFC